MKAGILVAFLGQQIERVDFLIAVKQPSDLPRDTLLDHPVTDAKPIEYFQCPLGPADCPRADRHDIVVVEDDGWHLVQSQIDGHRKADRTGTDNYNRIAVVAQQCCSPVLAASHNRTARTGSAALSSF